MPAPDLIVPSDLAWWREEVGGAEWLDALPRLVAECTAAWELELGAAFEPAKIAYVAPASLADGTRVVLKINFPEPESEHEAAALTHWDGTGAVALLAHDFDRSALLLERCEPADQLWNLADEEEANRVAAGVLRRLWKPVPEAHPLRLLRDEADRWAAELPAAWEAYGRPFERRLLDTAVAFLRDAGPSQGDEVVLHQDFHGGNVLRSGRGWLAIDPKPLAGEREFDLASLLRDRRDELAVDPRPGRRIRRRLDQLAGELGLDRERMRGWGVAHALAWGVWRDGWSQEMVACARWLAEV